MGENVISATTLIIYQMNAMAQLGKTRKGHACLTTFSDADMGARTILQTHDAEKIVPS